MSDHVIGHVIFHGRVQGVTFRYHTEQAARKLGVTGTVRNVSDGTVELYAEGTSEEVQALVDTMSGDEGPGHVDNIDVSYRQIQESSFSDFNIIY